VYYFSNTGAEEPVNSLKLYPNPSISSDDVIVEFNINGSELISLDIFNVLGEKVKSIAKGTFSGDQKVSFNTSGLAPGIYFVNLQSAKGVYSQRHSLSNIIMAANHFGSEPDYARGKPDQLF
jgi:hypothetical protein